MRIRLRKTKIKQNANIISDKKHKILFKSLKSKLMVSYILISLISIILIGSLTYINCKKVVITKVSELFEKASVQTNLSLNSYLNEIQDITSMVFSKNDILKYEPQSVTYNKYLKQAEITEYLNSLGCIKNFKDFALICSDGSSLGKISQKNNNKNSIKKTYEDILEILRNSRCESKWLTINNDSYNKLYYARIINDNSILLTSISVEELDTIFNVANDGNMELSLLDTEDNILFSNNKKLIGTKVENGINDNIKDIESKTFEYNNFLITLNTCSNNWRLLNKIPQQYILKEVEKSKNFTFIITIICIVISSTFGLFFAKKISSPINKLVMKMKEVENGDLSVFTDIIGEDEIAILSKSFNSMINSISDLIKQTRNVSIIVANQAEELKEISKQTSQTSEEICKSMEDITEGTVNQSNELEKTIEVMGNLSGSINKIIINITNAITIANETKNIGDSSLDIVKQLDKKTKNTNEVMAEITTNIDVLTNSIKEIEQVIELIKGISEQTNLLSLNASIEAARAGENGKGFAVVAEEVKKLADESKESAESIKNVIKNIYKKASYTKELIDNSRIVFNEQTESVKFANNSFITIINATEKITNEIQNIEKLINQINTEKLQTLEAANSMKFIVEISSEIAQEVLAATEEQTAGAENLVVCSSKLSDTVISLQENLNIFKTK